MHTQKQTRDTAAAREAATTALAGHSPRELGAKKRLAALRWVYRWGWSTAQIIDLVAARGRRGFAARLLRQGLLDAHPCEATGGVRGVPAQVLTLTPAGVEEIEPHLHDAQLLGYPRQATSLIIWRQLRHDVLVQHATAKAWVAEGIEAFRTPRELQKQSIKGQKQPDAVWHKAGRVVALELELSVKVGREFDQTILALLSVLGRLPGHQKLYDDVMLLSSSAAIITRYQRALQPGARLQLWERDAARRWEPQGNLQVPEGAIKRIHFQEIQT